jgi:hypothetical protein
MAIIQLDAKQAATEESKEREKRCDEVGAAVDQGTLGDIVAKHEKLILKYYEDVLQQANQSFKLARSIASIGFFVLIGSLVCAILLDILHRFGMGSGDLTKDSLSIATAGIIGTAIIEATAGGAFWLYAQTARQFSAFHICLERTHRYLLTYKMASELSSKKEDTLRDLACIMANAPMIGQGRIEPLPTPEIRP